MPTDRPLVTAIMPAYNARRFVRQALASVLQQTYAPLEVVVVDDGSTDDTAALVEAVARHDARVRLLRQPNRGVAAARNAAIEAARGGLVAPIDADDLWLPTKIERQVEVLQQGGPKVGLVYTWTFPVDEAGNTRPAPPGYNLAGDLLHTLACHNVTENASTPLMRRDALRRAGGYDETLRQRGAEGCEDWDVVLRLAAFHTVEVVPDHLVGYRAVHDSMSRQSQEMLRSQRLVLERVARAHPSIPSVLLRWSRSRFCFYRAGMHLRSGRYGEALRLLGWTVRADPLVLLAPGFSLTVARVLAAYARLSLPSSTPGARGTSRPAIQDEPPSWSAWKPYDRICARRWRIATRGAWRSRLPTAEIEPAPLPTERSAPS